jgi:hypothetical protein
MELKDFIKNTLEQIVEGVSLAQVTISENGGVINPSSIGYQKDGQWTQYNHAMPQTIEFNVCLTSTKTADSREGIGVFLGPINLGKKNDSGTEQVAVTRVQFTVPLVLPPGKYMLKKA